jgi:hypothetical protein
LSRNSSRLRMIGSAKRVNLRKPIPILHDPSKLDVFTGASLVQTEALRLLPRRCDACEQSPPPAIDRFMTPISTPAAVPNALSPSGVRPHAVDRDRHAAGDGCLVHRDQPP